MIFVQQRTAHLKSDFHPPTYPPYLHSLPIYTPSLPSLPSFSSTENLLNIHRPWGPCYLPVDEGGGTGQAQTNKKAGPALKVGTRGQRVDSREGAESMDGNGRRVLPKKSKTDFFYATESVNDSHKIWGPQSHHGWLSSATQVENRILEDVAELFPRASH